MNRYLAYIYFCGILAACGGSSGEGDTEKPTNGPDTKPDSEALLSFWKSELENLNQLAENSPEDSYQADFPQPVATPEPSVEGASDDFSSTNVQVAGVDELDALKFDGDVLLNLNTTANYYYFEGATNTTQTPSVRVLSEEVLEGNAPEDPSLHLEATENNTYKGLLTYDNFATLIGQENGNFWRSPVYCFDCWAQQQNSLITLDIWQYKEAQQPIAPSPSKLSIQGQMISARSIENKVYLLSSYRPTLEGFQYYPQSQQQVEENQAIIDSITAEDFVPEITINEETRALTGDQNCILPGDLKSENSSLPSLHILTEIDMLNPSNFKTFCVIEHVQETYFGKENIYLLSHKYQPEDDYSPKVHIRKITITDDGMESVGVGEINGSLSYDGYQLGEVDGKFAIVNTVYNDQSSGVSIEPIFFNDTNFYHQLTLLEETEGALEVLSQIPNETRPEPIGKPGERIYAVRFMNERAYVVTFDQVDPLYVIDLSDSSDPYIAGELEIPGFSDYVHVVGENLLFGIGKNAVNDGQTTWLQGLNIRLFDVSDPSQPTTLVDLDYGLRGSDSALLFDPHALAYTLNQDTGIARLAFPVRIHSGEASGNSPLNTYYDWQESALLQLEIDTQQKTMAEVARYVYASEETTGNTDGLNWYWSWGERSVINNSSLYFSHNNEVKVLQWGDTEVLRSFTFESQE